MQRVTHTVTYTKHHGPESVLSGMVNEDQRITCPDHGHALRQASDLRKRSDVSDVKVRRGDWRPRWVGDSLIWEEA